MSRTSPEIRDSRQLLTAAATEQASWGHWMERGGRQWKIAFLERKYCRMPLRFLKDGLSCRAALSGEKGPRGQRALKGAKRGAFSRASPKGKKPPGG